MKITTLLGTISILLLNFASADTIYLDNDPAHPADYRTFAEAHDAASDGDVIVVAPSAISYGQALITKQITVRGNGFGSFVNEISAAEHLTSEFGTITIGNGDDRSIASGSALQGIVASVSIEANQCTFQRCLLTVGVRGNSNIFTGCFIQSLTSGDNGVVTTGTTLNHCIFAEGTLSSGRISFHSSSNMIFNHCQVSLDLISFNNTRNATASFRNCFLNSNDASQNINFFFTARNCVFLEGVPPFTSGNDNISDTIENTYIDLERELLGTEYELQADSPAFTAASDGGQVGIFGGSSPFIVGAFPPVPRIIDLEIRSANTTSGITFTVEAEARN